MVETVVTVERTTTTTTGPPGGNPSAGDNGNFWSAIRLNLDYFKTAPGLIKIVQLVSKLIRTYIHMYVSNWIHINIYIYTPNGT